MKAGKAAAAGVFTASEADGSRWPTASATASRKAPGSGCATNIARILRAASQTSSQRRSSIRLRPISMAMVARIPETSTNSS